jgi:antitoxin component of MazEF toxin-antitoxin module
MRKKLVQIGNGKGVRLSRAALAKAGITDEVEMKVESGRIVLTRPGWHPRKGWAEDARRMVESGDEDTWPEDFEWPNEGIISSYVEQPDRINEHGSSRRSRQRTK